MQIINIADLKNPDDPQGRSYRETNAEMKHKIPLGALVEITFHKYKGVRLFVVHHARDCDQTPLYCLSHDPRDVERERDGFYNRKWLNGFGEESLVMIQPPILPESV